MSRHRFLVGCVLAAILLAPNLVAVVQQQSQLPALEAPGFQANRDYMSELSFERIDTLSGAVVLSFTDLVLPGNAGRELRFQRTYNSKNGVWSFGIAGIPLRISDPANPTGDVTMEYQDFTPALHTADGGVRKMAWADPPSNLYPATLQWAVSSDFQKYDRTNKFLYIPNGDVCHYLLDPNDADMRIVDYCQDAFGNRVEFTWEWATPQLKVKQKLGNSTRDILLPLEYALSTALPTSMSFDNRTWTYTRSQVTLPEDTAWFFEYNGWEMTRLTTPHGGKIDYTYDNLPFEGPDPQTTYQTRVLTDRNTSGPEVSGGHWHYEYQITGGGISGTSTITTPDGSRLSYGYGWNEAQAAVFDGESGVLVLRERTVERPSGQDWIPLEHEETTYELQHVLDWGSFGTLEVNTRTVTRYDEDGQTGTNYATDFHYSSPLDEFHQPDEIVETGTAGVRTTTRTYAHPDQIQLVPYIGGMPLTENVTFNNRTFSKSWAYDPITGFKESETVYGLETTFAKDGRGNVVSVTGPSGKWTTFEGYKYGQPQTLRTPMYAISRTINVDGSIALETRAGRTTTYQYDDLGRPIIKQPPGETNPTQIVYDDANRQVTVTRGSSVVTSELDGFGRTIKTTNANGVVVNTLYDAEGRVVREGYPYKTGFPDAGQDIYSIIAYDALGRVTSRTNPPFAQPTASTRTYFGDGRVMVTDEEGRQTQLVMQAFGNPDRSHVAFTVDAHQVQWAYSYNTLGQLETVLASDGKQRTWTYNNNGLLEAETHPESGTTLYAYVDGLLTTKTDANGLATTFTYDDNDRVISTQAGTQQTIFTYEVGSDNRVSATTTNPSTGVIWRYDPYTGRLEYRQDVLDGKTFTTLFEYDNNDNVKALIYPSGRRVQFNVNAEGQPTKIYEPAANRSYADLIAYHPSGGLAAYTAGNNIVTTITYDASRYWTKVIDAGAMHLEYNAYDGVGNPHQITDSRGAQYAQNFAYDGLDRLTDATGPYGAAHYDYDLHGNRSNSNYTYEPGTLRLSSDGTSTFTYDSNGNTITAGNDIYSYTARNQVATSFHDNVTTTYAYDVDEQRVAKSSGGSTTYYIHGPSGELLTEWKDPGTANGRVRDYVYLGSRLISAVARNTSELPPSYSTPLTPSHRWASSWQVPSGNGDNVVLNSGISAAARKAFHPDMPSTGLRLGVQSTTNVNVMANGPLFPEIAYTKQGGVFIEFEVERRPFSTDGEWLGTAGGWSSTDDLRVYISPAGSLVVKHDDGRVPAQTLYTSPPLELLTTHTLELRFGYNSTNSFVSPNPVWENLTSHARVFLDGELVATYGANPGGTWDSGENNPIGLDWKTGNGALSAVRLKSPGPANGLLMNVFKAGITAANQNGKLDPYGKMWRTTLLQVAGPGTYSDWTGGQPDWRAHTAIHGSLGSMNVVTTTAPNQKISYLMESMASRGITGNIGVVMIGIRNAYATAGSQAFIRRNGVDTMLPELTLPSSTNSGLRWYRVSEGGWSPTDTIEVGMVSGSTTGNTWLTSVAVMVEHNSPEPPPSTDTSARVVTVNYTGNGTGQTINLGVDMMPTALFVMPSSGAQGVEPLIWWEGRQGAEGFAAIASTFGRVWPQKGKLQVVHPTAGDSYNANGVNYTAIALFDPSGRYLIPFGVAKPSAEDNYTHRLRLPQSGELAETFVPDFVFGGVSSTTNGDSNFGSFYKGVGQAGDSTVRLGVAQAADADRIQSMAAGEVQFGKSIGSQYGDPSFFAGRVSDGIAPERLMAVATYVGDGTASRNISLDLNGESPVFALVMPLTAVAKVYRVSTDTTGRQSWSGNAVANSITAMGANEITVGSAMNTLGVTYDVWAIRPGMVSPW